MEDVCPPPFDVICTPFTYSAVVLTVVAAIFVDVTFVKMPVDGVVLPIVVPLIVPPEIVTFGETRLAALSREPEAFVKSRLVNVPLVAKTDEAKMLNAAIVCELNQVPIAPPKRKFVIVPFVAKRFVDVVFVPVALVQVMFVGL